MKQIVSELVSYIGYKILDHYYERVMGLLHLTYDHFQALFFVLIPVLSHLFPVPKRPLVVGLCSFIPVTPRKEKKAPRLSEVSPLNMHWTQHCFMRLYFTVSSLFFRRLKTDVLTCGFNLVHAAPFLNNKYQFHRREKIQTTARYNIPQ